MEILYMLLLVMCLLSEGTAQFEDGASVCAKCTCLLANSTATVMSYDMLDCSGSNMRHMIDNWPARFETTNPQREIVVSLSGNDIVQLQQLPPTQAILVFSCRRCKLETLASGLFLDTPNVLRADFSSNNLEGAAFSADVFRGQYVAEENDAPLALDVLDLRNNVITQFADDAFKYITSVRYLYLAYNPLGQISDSTAGAMKQLVHLEILDLSYASLTAIDSDVFEAMHALKELFIQGNQFAVIPDAVFRTTSLTSLNIGENPIDTFHISEPLDYLHHLNMSSMPLLSSILVDSFQNVKSLQSLTSRNNTALEVFDLQVLEHVTDLQELDLSQSNIKHLTPPNNKYNNSSSDNAINSLRPIIGNNKLDKLQLENNPWHCDCDLQHVLMVVGLKLAHEDDSRCETPNMLVSLHLSDLLSIEVCDIMTNDGPKNAIYEKPAFLRPRAIYLTIISVGIVLGAGVIIGLIIVCLKRRLKNNDVGFTSPVRYTSVRESTPSAVYQL